MNGYLPVKCKDETLKCLVDPDVEAKYSGKRLWLSGGYVQIYVNGTVKALHSVISSDIDCKGFLTDHRSGNKLDCRRSNLRSCTWSVNLHNLHTYSKALSGNYGVHYRKHRGAYMIRMTLRTKTIYCGHRWKGVIIASLVSDGYRRAMLGSENVTQNWNNKIEAKELSNFFKSCTGKCIVIHYSDPYDGHLVSIRKYMGGNPYGNGGNNNILLLRYGLVIVRNAKSVINHIIRLDSILAIEAGGNKYRVKF